MKRVIRLLSTFLLATSLFAMISCSNDSVDNSAPAPQPETKPTEKEITLTIKPGSNIGVYNESGKDNTIGKGKLIFGGIPKIAATAKVENLGMVVSETYKYYDYVVKNEGTTTNPVHFEMNGIILSKEEIKEKEIKVKVSSDGVKIDFDRTKIAFDGTYLQTKDGKCILLSSGKNIYTLIPENNKTEAEKLAPFVGNWKCQENGVDKYTLSINKDGNGVLGLDKGVEKKFKCETNTAKGINIKEVGTDNPLGIIRTSLSDKNPRKIIWFPDTSLKFDKLLYEFIVAQ